MAINRILITPEFRMSFPNLLKPKEFMEKGKPTGKKLYSMEMLILENLLGKFLMPKDNAFVEVDINTVLAELAKEAWGSEIDPELKRPLTVKEMFAGPLARGWPLKRGDVIADAIKLKGKQGEHYRGHRMMACKSNVADNVNPPTLQIAAKGGAKTLSRMVEADMATARTAFRGGNYAIAELNIKPNVVSGLKYLTVYVNLVRYTRDGAALGGVGGSAMERFDGINGGQADHDPTQGIDDEIPY